MSRRIIKNTFLVILFLGYIVLYKLFIFENYMKYSEIISSSFTLILFALSVRLLGFRKNKPNFLSRNVFKVVLMYVLIAFVGMYGVGFMIGFLKNGYSRSLLTLFDNILSPLLIIIFIELFRYVVIWANKDKKMFIYLFTAVIILFEIAISVRTIPLNDPAALFKVMATTIIPITIKNIMLSYLTYNVGYKPSLLYRLVMDLYLFIVPLIPDLGEYLNSMILISLPVVIYIGTFTIIDEREDKDVNIIEKSNFGWSDVPLTVGLIVLAALVSGFFPHYMMGVGSQSMSPAVNKGDAVILKKVKTSQTLDKGQIIAYTKGKKIIIHRIIEVTKSKGDVVYVTKGDANNGKDSQVVQKKQVKGVVKLRIPFIAYPTVWLSEYMENSKK